MGELWVMPGGSVLYTLEEALFLKDDNENLDFHQASDEEIQAILFNSWCSESKINLVD
jgi:hypothetical protein